jgi:hypothetical protein
MQDNESSAVQRMASRMQRRLGRDLTQTCELAIAIGHPASQWRCSNIMGVQECSMASSYHSNRLQP